MVWGFGTQGSDSESLRFKCELNKMDKALARLMEITEGLK